MMYSQIEIKEEYVEFVEVKDEFPSDEQYNTYDAPPPDYEIPSTSSVTGSGRCLKTCRSNMDEAYIKAFNIRECFIHLVKLEPNAQTIYQQNTTESEVNQDGATHTETHQHQTPTFPCQLCSKVYSNSKLLQNHVNKHKVLHRCTLCSKHFARKGYLRAHMVGVHGERKTSSCPVCNKQVKYLKRHMANVHSNSKDKKIFPCPQCTVTFVYKSNLYKHLDTVHARDRKIFSCLLCSATFTQKSSMRTHIESFHLGLTSCNVCGKKYYEKRVLAIHMRSHHLDFPFHRCTLCGKDFIMKEYLSKHITNVHCEPKPCPVCKKYVTNIQRHVAYVHSRNKKKSTSPQCPPIKKFSCPQCTVTFVHESNIKKHLETVHSSDKKTFACLHCPATYTLKGSLKRHIEGVHLGIKKHCCNVCGHKVYNKDNLVLHMRRHKVKPFQRTICDKKFFTKNHLIRHSAVHSHDRNFT